MDPTTTLTSGSIMDRESSLVLLAIVLVFVAFAMAVWLHGAGII